MLEGLANLVVGQEDDGKGDEEAKRVDVSHVGQLFKEISIKFNLDFQYLIDVSHVGQLVEQKSIQFISGIFYTLFGT